MQSRLRVFLAFLLLFAAGVHPLVHVAATQECPCVHGATTTLPAPDFVPALAAVIAHPGYVSVTLTASHDGELPPRAPPAA